MSHKNPTQYYDVAKHIALAIPNPDDQIEAIENALLEIEQAIEQKCPRACARHFADLKLNLARLATDGECDFCEVEDKVVQRAADAIREGWKQANESNAKGS